MPPDPGERVATAAELAELENLIEAWLDRQRAENPLLLEADRGEPDLRRWRLRLAGEEKDVTTVWLTVDQRTISYETYVMPAPDEDHARFYEHLMRRNRQFNGVAFCIGDEDGVYLRGQLPVWAVTDDELDRIVGSLYAYVEQCFRPALR
ncbi:MAG: YbjN domain-containing protein, partial [Acidimicrobiales bacterium]